MAATAITKPYVHAASTTGFDGGSELKSIKSIASSGHHGSIANRSAPITKSLTFGYADDRRTTASVP
jgi:hypothetical protein